MPLDNKISNILGAAMPDWLKQQLNVRSQQNSKDLRDDTNLLYLANKTAWVRLVSSVNINGNNDTSANANQKSADLKWFSENLGTVLEKDEDLAKKYILYGGTSKYLKPTQGESFEYKIRSGIEDDGAYGMLGEREVSKYGYRPMPGITDVRIETQGRLGSVRMATVNFKVWDKMQLDIMDTLYFKLGYTMLLEWANTVYYKSSQDPRFGYVPTLESTEFEAIDPFAPKMDKEKIQIQISQNVRKTQGNYDAMLGIVTNFNFSFNQEGGYDCSIKIIALGALGDSIKINNPTALPDVVKQKLKEYAEILDRKKAEAKSAEENAKKALVRAGEEKQIKDDYQNKKKGLKTYDEIIRSSRRKQDLCSSNTPTPRKAIVAFNDPFAIAPRNYYLPAQASDADDIFAINKSKSFINATNKKLIGQTTVNLNLSLLDTIVYNIDNVAKQFAFPIGYTLQDRPGGRYITNDELKASANGSYTDLLVYNPLWDINAKRKDFEYWNTGSKNPANTITAPDLGYKEGVDGFSAAGIGVNDYTNTALAHNKFIVNHIQYTVDYTVYRVDLSIPYYVTDTKNEQTIYPSSKNLNNKSLKNTTDSNSLDYLTIRKAIINVINNNDEAWKIDLWANPQLKPILPLKDLNLVDYKNGIFVDKYRNQDSLLPESNGNRQTMGLALYKDVKVKLDFLEEVTVKNLNTTKTEIQTVTREFKFKVGLLLTDFALVESINQPGSATKDSLTAEEEEKLAELGAVTAVQPETKTAEQISTQVEMALKLQSNFELTLKAIQLYGLSNALTKEGTDLNTVITLSPSQGDLKKFYEEIFKYGVYKSFLSDLLDDKINELELNNKTGDDWIKTYRNLDVINKLKISAKYGFSSAVLGGHSDIDNIKPVDYNELMSIYVVPYKPNTSTDGAIEIIYSTYVQLGMVFMILNDMCTIYDTKPSPNNESQSTPLVYIDYNPETNRCLSSPQQFTTNAFDFLIPFQANDSDYLKLFPEGTYDPKIKALQGDEAQALFSKEKEDKVSQSLPYFREINKTTGAYSGKTMKVLVGIDYLLSLVKEYANQEGSNSVYLKPFIERILKDMNNYLGNVNVFRLAYTDSSNTYSIVDDQFQPLIKGQTYVSSALTDEIPVFGKKSIAKSINIQTEISSKLSNMIAISSNSNPKDQATLSTNATPFGFINSLYKDRYISNKGAQKYDAPKINNQQDKTSITSIRSAAQRFNSTIKSFYSLDLTNQPSKDNVSQATNFYISQMSQQMAENKATRSAAMIPVSVNFTTDGISGFYMGQAFTLPEQLLPYTYSQRSTQYSPNADKKVAFATVGVTHEIANNTWQTNIKGSMIFIKKELDFSGSSLNNTSPAIAIDNGANSYGNGSENVNLTKFVASGDLSETAKKVAEEYINKSITNDEWNKLIAAVNGESGKNEQGKEDAYIAAVILNRSRNSSITKVLSAENQFQAVTGLNPSHKPSKGFISGPSTSTANIIYQGIIKYLRGVNKRLKNFTSNNPKAYGPNSNIDFMYQLRKTPGAITIGGISGTVFAVLP